MLFFLISCLSFILLSKSFSLQPWLSEIRLFLFTCLWKDFFCYFLTWLRKTWLTGIWILISYPMPMRRSLRSKVENVEETQGTTLMDLPELLFESILEKLSPSELCNMASVCRSLRDQCTRDHLWEKHMKEKWGGVIGPVAQRQWNLQIATAKDFPFLDRKKKKMKRSLIRSLSCVCSSSWIRPKSKRRSKLKNSLPVDSIMSWYLSLESGRFWFPAQVYNREREHVGFMLSCYDAELSYDSFTDTFQARYPPHGPRASVIEEGIGWNRIRESPVNTSPHHLHVSDCLNDLYPGDHIEIQWRKSRDFPNGWWYGVVGHLETCEENQNLCNCYRSDSVVLQFNQYNPGSRWRQTTVNRKEHHEKGNDADGFYGGIRKLYRKEEISAWKGVWPKDVLQ